MLDAVTTPDGHTYSEAHIKKVWKALLLLMAKSRAHPRAAVAAGKQQH